MHARIAVGRPIGLDSLSDAQVEHVELSGLSAASSPPAADEAPQSGRAHAGHALVNRLPGDGDGVVVVVVVAVR
jgi:hypothetical protein